MANVSLKNIKKNYDEVEVVHDLNLEIKDGEFVVLVGPSGCGKSTTLRMVAGLEDITAGELQIDGVKMNEVPPGDRGVAMVFQDYALYPHMTVFENLAFGLRLKKVPEDEIKTRVNEVAKMLDLEMYLERKPAQLSGGQRQRVAMGRAIAKRAKVFLYDEPLSNLDAKLRSKMRGEIKRFHLQAGTTSVYVTHDQLEAMTLADRLVVMKDGDIEQMGTPLEVYSTPRTLFVASFIGSPGMNFFDVVIKKEKDKMLAQSIDGAFSFELPESRTKLVEDGMKLVMGIRPCDIFISQKDDKIPEVWKHKAEVVMVEPLGKNAYITLKIGQNEFLGEIAGMMLPKFGDELTISFNLNFVHLFDGKTGKNKVASA